jgi:hypothetical protein
MKFIAQVRTHLAVMGRHLGPMEYWFQNRFGTAEAELKDLVRLSQVSAFVSDYAESLRKSLEDLFASGAWDVLEEIPMDYIEELVLQTRSYVEMMVGRSAPCEHQQDELLDLDLPELDPALLANVQVWAEAA